MHRGVCSPAQVEEKELTRKVSAKGAQVLTHACGNRPALIWSLAEDDEELELGLADDVGVAGSVWIENVWSEDD